MSGPAIFDQGKWRMNWTKIHWENRWTNPRHEGCRHETITDQDPCKSNIELYFWKKFLCKWFVFLCWLKNKCCLYMFELYLIWSCVIPDERNARHQSHKLWSPFHGELNFVGDLKQFVGPHDTAALVVRVVYIGPSNTLDIQSLNRNSWHLH